MAIALITIACSRTRLRRAADAKRYEKWKDIVSISGPQGLRLIKGFHDESLRGEWKGHRSSRLGKQFRVIYRIEKELILIQVVSITAPDYRKK